MGAEQFCDRVKGKNAKEAFETGVDQALYDYGHRGYTGTLAEKGGFVMVEVPEGHEPDEYAEKLMDECGERIDDKWGPAGCIKTAEGEYLFFGWASS